MRNVFRWLGAVLLFLSVWALAAFSNNIYILFLTIPSAALWLYTFNGQRLPTFYWSKLKSRWTQATIGIIFGAHILPVWLVLSEFPDWGTVFLGIAIVHCLFELLLICSRKPKPGQPSIEEIKTSEQKSLETIEAIRQKILASATETELDVKAQHAAIMKRIRREN